MTQPVTTRPAPTPLPPAWARAVANSLASEFARPKPHAPYGWDKADKLREWHPTGRPAGHTIKTTSTVPKTPLLDSTELLSRTYFLAGTISPDEYADLGVPALAWYVEQPIAVGALLDAIPEDVRHLVDDAMNHLARIRSSGRLYQRSRNRHGTLVLRRDANVDPHAALGWEVIARAATLHVLDTAEYWDWLSAADELNAAELFHVLEEGGP